MSNYPTANSSSAPPPPWIELPRDVTANILGRLGPEDILDGAGSVCTTWRSVCGEPSLWRVFHMKYSYEIHTHDYARSVCRRAVNRSKGELTVVNISCFGTDDLLGYIFERSSRLRVLILQFCLHISPRGLTTAVENFPYLEELHLNSMWSICALDIETIGVSCPNLKSFAFTPSYIKHGPGDVDNRSAVSIAKSMPNLSRLHLIGNPMGNEGLLAILNGCSKLESLDLRRCFGVVLQSDIGRKCSRQIRELRCPTDSAADDYL